jgi:hypothetical protein
MKLEIVLFVLLYDILDYDAQKELEIPEQTSVSLVMTKVPPQGASPSLLRTGSEGYGIVAETISADSGYRRSDRGHHHGCCDLDQSSIDKECVHGRLLVSTRVGHKLGYDRRPCVDGR